MRVSRSPFEGFAQGVPVPEDGPEQADASSCAGDDRWTPGLLLGALAAVGGKRRAGDLAGTVDLPRRVDPDKHIPASPPSPDHTRATAGAEAQKKGKTA